MQFFAVKEKITNYVSSPGRSRSWHSVIRPTENPYARRFAGNNIIKITITFCSHIHLPTFLLLSFKCIKVFLPKFDFEMTFQMERQTHPESL